MAEGSNRIRSNKENMTVVTEGNDVIFSHSKQEITNLSNSIPLFKMLPLAIINFYVLRLCVVERYEVPPRLSPLALGLVHTD